MFNVGVSFKILEYSENIPVGWCKATGHLLGDKQIDDTRTAQWAMDGHRTSDDYNEYMQVFFQERVYE